MRGTEKKFYKIGEIAEILNVPCSTLRFWEKEFPSIQPKRNAKNTRYYTLEDLENLKLVHYLVKEKGLRLEAAEQQIRQNRKNVSKRHEVVERLKSIHAELKGISEVLDAIS